VPALSASLVLSLPKRTPTRDRNSANNSSRYRERPNQSEYSQCSRKGKRQALDARSPQSPARHRPFSEHVVGKLITGILERGSIGRLADEESTNPWTRSPAPPRWPSCRRSRLASTSMAMVGVLMAYETPNRTSTVHAVPQGDDLSLCGRHVLSFAGRPWPMAWRVWRLDIRACEGAAEIESSSDAPRRVLPTGVQRDLGAPSKGYWVRSVTLAPAAARLTASIPACTPRLVG
jgi:hypothetical protein